MDAGAPRVHLAAGVDADEQLGRAWADIRALAAEDGSVDAALPTLIARIGTRRAPVEALLERLRSDVDDDGGDEVAARAVQLVESALRTGLFR